MREIINKSKKIGASFDKNWMNVSFFMACPLFLLFGQNITLLFIVLLISKFNNKVDFWSFRRPIQIVVIAFALGAMMSVLNTFGDESFYNSIVVLPNYIYWSIIVWFSINLVEQLNFDAIRKGISYGLILYCIIYVFLPFLTIPGFIVRATPNSFSLLLICYAPILCVFIKQKKGLKYSLFVLAILLLILLFEGRRAGSILTFLASLGALFLPSIKARNLSLSVILGFSLTILFATEIGESIVLSLNPRVHELIYEQDKVITEDRSYLFRKLMVEKGMQLFEREPLFGIGLNNFNQEEVEFEGEFVGSEFVINKEGNNDKSSHNSYINLLAEGGLFLIIPFIILLLYNIVQFIRQYNNRSMTQNSFYWGFLAMCIHLYFITGIINVYVWFLIALCTAMSTQKYSQSKK